MMILHRGPGPLLFFRPLIRAALSIGQNLEVFHTVQCDPYRFRYSDGDPPPGINVAAFKVAHTAPVYTGQLGNLLPSQLHLNAAGLHQLR